MSLDQHVFSATDSVGSRRARTVREGGRIVVHLFGEYDSSNVESLGETLAAAASAGEEHLVVDLSGLRFLDSATVRVLERAAGYAGAKSRVLVLRSPTRFSRRVIELCGAGSLIELNALGF